MSEQFCEFQLRMKFPPQKPAAARQLGCVTVLAEDDDDDDDDDDQANDEDGEDYSDAAARLGCVTVL